MTVRDFSNIAMHYTGMNIGNEALIYYNEMIDYLLAIYPEKITAPIVETVEIGSDRRFQIPRLWASVLKVKNQAGRRVYCDTNDDTLIFPYSGTFEIRYTKKPSYIKTLDEETEHNRIFNMCIPYYFAWKMSERDQLSANKIQKYQMQFLDYLNAAVKVHARQGLRYIKTKPLI